METFIYKSDLNAKGTVPCPYFADIYIGSIACWNCQHFKKVDLKNKIVCCMFKENNKENE